MKIYRWITVLGTAAIMALPGAASADGAVDFQAPGVEQTEPDRVGAGISIEGVDVSGLTEVEMETALQAHFRELESASLVLSAKGKEYAATWKELGYAYQAEEVYAQAMQLGKGMGLIGRYVAAKDMANTELALTVPYSVDSASVRNFVENIQIPEGEPVNASITRVKKKFQITPETEGYCIDVEPTVKAILSAAETKAEADLRVEAAIAVLESSVKAADLETIQDVLGTFTTKVSGTEARYHNVQLGSSNINGLVLMPGESASASDLMQPRTAENGYEMAPQYVDGDTVDAYGGGICQVSTTLYNALLRAEIRIDERCPHSMKVSYVQPSMDAAISAGYKDMRFTNDLDRPIYIQAVCKNRKLTFTVYGTETRDTEHRKVVYESHVTYQHQQADKVKYDKNEYEGYVLKQGQRHPVTNSYLDKVVYVDGVEVSRETLHSDNYAGSVRTITYGTKPKPAETTAATETTAAKETP